MQTIEETIKTAVRDAVREVLAEQKAPPVVEGSPALSIKETSAEYGISTTTLYQWIHRADCDFVIQVGRNNKILRHKFVAYLDRRAGQRETAPYG